VAGGMLPGCLRAHAHAPSQDASAASSRHAPTGSESRYASPSTPWLHRPAPALSKLSPSFVQAHTPGAHAQAHALAHGDGGKVARGRADEW